MSRNQKSIAQSRRGGTRRPSRKVLVLGEGKSEVAYFKGFTGPDRHVVVRAVGTETTDPAKILRLADRYIEDFGLDLEGEDRVAIVMDVDANKRAELLRKVEKFAAKGIEVYISNPSFEVWLILHFENYAKCEEPIAVTERLDSIMVKRTGRHYEKSEGIRWTDDMLDTALKNAAGIQKKNGCTLEWCFDTRPSTMVHKLVETIRRRGRRPLSPDIRSSLW